MLPAAAVVAAAWLLALAGLALATANPAAVSAAQRRSAEAVVAARPDGDAWVVTWSGRGPLAVGDRVEVEASADGPAVLMLRRTAGGWRVAAARAGEPPLRLVYPDTAAYRRAASEPVDAR